jgi:hypothetical protein
VSFEIFGISMAGYNALFTFCCGLSFLVVARMILKAFHLRAKTHQIANRSFPEWILLPIPV